MIFTGKPFCSRHYVFCQVLEQFIASGDLLVQAFQKNLNLVDIVLNSTIRFYFQSMDVNIKSSVVEGYYCKLQ